MLAPAVSRICHHHPLLPQNSITISLTSSSSSSSSSFLVQHKSIGSEADHAIHQSIELVSFQYFCHCHEEAQYVYKKTQEE
jgi:hypothetical protein